MASTPPGALPIISETTTVRFKLGALIAVMSFVVGASIWATVFYQTATQWMASVDKRFGRIERVLGIDEEEAFKKSSTGKPARHEDNP